MAGRTGEVFKRNRDSRRDMKAGIRKLLIIIAIILVFFLCLQAPWKYLIEETSPRLEVSIRIGQNDTLRLFSFNEKYKYVYSYLSILIILSCIILIFTNTYKKIFAFLKDIIQGRKLIFELAKKDLQKRYLGSYLGVIWAFIQPVTTILIFWFVFEVGFKSAPVEDVPFILWLVCGMIPWFFFSDSLTSAMNSILENAYLVKKVVFRVSVLPIIRIISALFVHVFFVLIIFIMMLAYGYPLSIYNIQVVYYLVCIIALVLGLSWITSSLVIFLKDLGQIIGILIQFWFWLTPIFWSLKTIPGKYQFLLKLNPVYYIVQGYRDSFIDHVWFWNYYNQTVSFWVITISIFIIGALIFRKLRPHFADVL